MWTQERKRKYEFVRSKARLGHHTYVSDHELASMQDWMCNGRAVMPTSGVVDREAVKAQAADNHQYLNTHFIIENRSLK